MQRYLFAIYSRLSNKIRRSPGKNRGHLVGAKWLESISVVNRWHLVGPSLTYLCRQPGWRRFEHLDYVIKLYLAGIDPRYRYLWPVALNALGAEWNCRLHSSSPDLEALLTMFDQNIDKEGEWRTPINYVDCAMKGYTLLFLVQSTGERHYQHAACRLAEFLLEDYPRAADGSLVYNPSSQLLLVDTLGMVCPFLARYARQLENTTALSLSVNQLVQFVRANVDIETHLPYHGYYAGGSKRLGLHGWGRGVGWYMLGLVDTLAELPRSHTDFEELGNAFGLAADSLRAFQRPDGHWSWAIPHLKEAFDSSATAMIGYSLVRGIQESLLDESFWAVVEAAICALVDVTRVDGYLEGALGECQGLGNYPQIYGVQPWLQGAATALASVYFATHGHVNEND